MNNDNTKGGVTSEDHASPVASSAAGHRLTPGRIEEICGDVNQQIWLDTGHSIANEGCMHESFPLRFAKAIESELANAAPASVQDQAVPEAAQPDLQQQLQTMRAAFHINMLRAFPDKSHAEISAEIDKAVDAAPSVQAVSSEKPCGCIGGCVLEDQPLPAGVCCTKRVQQAKFAAPAGAGAVSSDAGERDLPPLPGTGEQFPHYEQFNGHDMRRYARAALTAHAGAQTAPACPRGCTGPENGGSGCMAVIGECAMDAAPTSAQDQASLASVRDTERLDFLLRNREFHFELVDRRHLLLDGRGRIAGEGTTQRAAIDAIILRSASNSGEGAA